MPDGGLIRVKPWFDGIPRGIATVIELATVCSAVWAMNSALGWSSAVYGLPWVGPAGAGWLSHGGSTLLPFGLLIVATACGRGYLARLLNLWPLVLLGEISYAVYLFHQVLMRGYSSRLASINPFPQWVTYMAFWVLLLALSYLSWRFIETPARRVVAKAVLRPNARGQIVPAEDVARVDSLRKA